MQALMAESARPRQTTALRGRWLWLFPASYASTSPRRVVRENASIPGSAGVIGHEISPAALVGLHLAYPAVMVVAVRRAREREDAAWVVPALETITAMNEVGHLAGSVVTRSYSPGVVSGVGVWVPRGPSAVMRSRQLLPRPVWRRGLMAGALTLGNVALVAVPLSHQSQSSAATFRNLLALSCTRTPRRQRTPSHRRSSRLRSMSSQRALQDHRRFPPGSVLAAS